MPPSDGPLSITPEAAARLRTQADFSTSVLCVRHLLGCGGTGFRISVEENAPDEGHRFEASGIPVVMDELAFRRLKGAVLELDPDPAGDGYRLDHPDAVMTTFC
jgi:Fe-S cluster assembly iron-binding protein IscA